MLAAFPGFDDRVTADSHDVVEAHVGDCGGAVETALGFHLQDQVLDRFHLVLVQVQGLGNHGIAFGQLRRGEAHGDLGPFRVIFDQVHDPVKAAVDAAPVVAGAAEIVSARTLTGCGDAQCMVDELFDALALHRADGHDGDSQARFQLVDQHRPSVRGHFIHHVQRQHHGDVQFQKLHGQVHVAFDVGGIDDVDDGVGGAVQQKLPGNYFLLGVGAHRIDAGQVGNLGVRMSANRPVGAVHGDAGEIAHVLVRTGELVEQGGLAAVLVAGEREGELPAFQGAVPADPLMRCILLAQAGVLPFVRMPARVDAAFDGGLLPASLALGVVCLAVMVAAFGQGGDRYPAGIVEAQGEVVSVDSQLQRVAHGSQLDCSDLCLGDEPHIQEMLSQAAASPDRFYPGAAPQGDVRQGARALARFLSSCHGGPFVWGALGARLFLSPGIVMLSRCGG